MRRDYDKRRDDAPDDDDAPEMVGVIRLDVGLALAAFLDGVPQSVREHPNEDVRRNVRLAYLAGMVNLCRESGDAVSASGLAALGRAEFADPGRAFDPFVAQLREWLRDRAEIAAGGPSPGVTIN